MSSQEIMLSFVSWTKLKVRMHLREDRLFFKEREIWWVSVGMNIGYEQNGKNETFERPILILKKFNHDLLWALPFTSKKKVGKYYHPVLYEGDCTFLILSQLRLMSSKRLLRKVRTLSQKEFDEVRNEVKKFL